MCKRVFKLCFWSWFTCSSSSLFDRSLLSHASFSSKMTPDTIIHQLFLFLHEPLQIWQQETSKNLQKGMKHVTTTLRIDSSSVENLTWSLNTSSILKKAQQPLYFLRRLKKAHLLPPILTTFYRGIWPSQIARTGSRYWGRLRRSSGSLFPPSQTFTQHAVWAKLSVLQTTPHTNSSPSYCLAEGTETLRHGNIAWQFLPEAIRLLNSMWHIHPHLLNQSLNIN